MINKDRTFFQYNSGDLVYIISPLTSQLCTASRKVMTKYVGPVVTYKIIDPHNYLLIKLCGKILRGLFEHEQLKPTKIRPTQGNVQNLAQLKTNNKRGTSSLDTQKFGMMRTNNNTILNFNFMIPVYM